MKYKSSNHFYDHFGNPRFDANLRDAKKRGYYPSITTIMKIINKPGLETWKQEQIIDAVIDHPFGQHEGCQSSYKDYIAKCANEKSSDAIEFGKFFHKAIESHVNGEIQSFEDDEDDYKVRKTIDVFSWIDDNFFSGVAEKALVSNSYKFGGTIDFFGKDFDNNVAVIDWKTQDIKLNEYKKSTGIQPEFETEHGTFLRPKPNYYNEMLLQLCACKVMLEENDKNVHKLMSVIINSDPFIDSIHVKEYSQDDVDWGTKVFLNLVDFYRLYNKF